MQTLEHHPTGWRRRNSHAVGELIHDRGQTGEGQYRDEGKGQLPGNQKHALSAFLPSR